MPSQMARPHGRRKLRRRIKQNVRRHSFCHDGQNALLLRLDFPKHARWDSNGAQDLGTKCIQQNNDGCPRVTDLGQGDEGGFPLDARQGSLVSCFEKVEGTQQTQNDRADGGLTEVVSIDDFEKRKQLPNQYSDCASAHWLLEHSDGEIPDGDQ